MQPDAKQTSAGVDHIVGARALDCIRNLSRQDRVESGDGYLQYRPLAQFLAGVPWTTANLRASAAVVSQSGLRLVSLQSSERAYLWLFDPQASWAEVVVRKKTPPTIAGAEMTVRDLAPGAFRVQWWDAWSGAIVHEETTTTTDGVLHQTVPTFTRDIACKLEISDRQE